MQFYACKFCIARYGLTGPQVGGVRFTDEDWERIATHIERDHGYPVPRENETLTAAIERVTRLYGVSIPNPSFVFKELYGGVLTTNASMAAMVIRRTGPILAIRLLKEAAQMTVMPGG